MAEHTDEKREAERLRADDEAATEAGYVERGTAIVTVRKEIKRLKETVRAANENKEKLEAVKRSAFDEWRQAQADRINYVAKAPSMGRPAAPDFDPLVRIDKEAELVRAAHRHAHFSAENTAAVQVYSAEIRRLDVAKKSLSALEKRPSYKP